MDEPLKKPRGPLTRLADWFIALQPIGTVRAAIWGAVIDAMLVMGVALPIAAIRNERPFNRYKGAGDSCMEFSRSFGVPVGALIGSMLGVGAAVAFRKAHVKGPRDTP